MQDKQVFITTHSPIFLDRAEKNNNWLVQIDGIESIIYRFKAFKDALESIGAKPGDRLMPETVLLVEGLADKAYVVECAKKLKVNLDNLLVIPIFGKGQSRRNLDAWNPVVQGTQIRLLLMLDNDARCIIENLVKRGIINDNDYLLLEEEIEDIYPVELVKKAMKEVFNYELDPLDPLTPPRKDYLEEQMKSHDITLERWDEKLAEKIGQLSRKDDIYPPLAALLGELNE